MSTINQSHFGPFHDIDFASAEKSIAEQLQQKVELQQLMCRCVAHPTFPRRKCQFSGKISALQKLTEKMWEFGVAGTSQRRWLAVPLELLQEAFIYCSERVACFAHRKQNHRARVGRRYYERWATLIDQEISRREAQTDDRAVENMTDEMANFVSHGDDCICRNCDSLPRSTDLR